jgi:hypothetical protein
MPRLSSQPVTTLDAEHLYMSHPHAYSAPRILRSIAISSLGGEAEYNTACKLYQ